MSENEPNKMVHYGLWVGQVLMALLFTGAGMTKLTTPQPELVDMGMNFAGRLPEPAAMVIGGLEALGAVGLILPAALRIVPILTPAAAFCLSLAMVVAAVEHAVAGEFGGMGPTLVLATICGVIGFGRLQLAPIQAR